MIFYFSGTGNSKHVAERLARGVRHEAADDGLQFGGSEEEKVHQDFEEPLIDMAEEMKRRKLRYPVEEKETIGFVFPVYYYGVPKVVEDFVRDFELVGLGPTNYVYLVLTCGGSTGNAGKRFERLLAEHKYNLTAQYAVKMVDNYVVLFSMADEKKQQELLDNAEKEIDKIIEMINRMNRKDANKIKGMVPGLMTTLAYPLYRRGRSTSKFTVSDDCGGCGRCEKSCPFGAIAIGENRKPVWEKEQCILCLRCLHACPREAVNYGKKSARNGRYRHWLDEEKGQQNL